MNWITYGFSRIRNDLAESRISWKIAFLFIPAAFLTYLFHESGHWLTGEVLGNDMILRLNESTARSGQYAGIHDNLYVSMGGPAFTMLQAGIFLVIIELTGSINAFPFVFFAAFSRVFSLIFGGFIAQDEARIASLLDIGEYWIAVLVVLILLVMVRRAGHLLKLNLKAIGYYLTLSTMSILLVILVNRMLT